MSLHVVSPSLPPPHEEGTAATICFNVYFVLVAAVPSFTKVTSNTPAEGQTLSAAAFLIRNLLPATGAEAKAALTTVATPLATPMDVTATATSLTFGKSV